MQLERNYKSFKGNCMFYVRRKSIKQSKRSRISFPFFAARYIIVLTVLDKTGNRLCYQQTKFSYRRLISYLVYLIVENYVFVCASDSRETIVSCYRDGIYFEISENPFVLILLYYVSVLCRSRLNLLSTYVRVVKFETF